MFKYPLIRKNLPNLKIGQKIGLGYLLSLWIVMSGTAIGFSIGNFHQQEARQARDHVRKEIELLRKLQLKVFKTRINQEQLIRLSRDPEGLEEKYTQLLQHGRAVLKTLKELKAFVGQSDHPEESGHHEQMPLFLETYESIPKRYIQELNILVEQILQSNPRIPEEVEQAEQLLSEFNNSDLALTFNRISDDLTDLIDDSYGEYEQATRLAQQANKIATNWIFGSIVLSVTSAILLAVIVSRAIARPIANLTKVAQFSTQELNFDLQAEIEEQGEIGQLSNAFNQLIGSVKKLLNQQQITNQSLAREVSKKNQLLEELKQTQHQMYQMTENVPGMIYTYIIHTDGSDELTYVNSQMREVFQIEPEVALQDMGQIWARVHPDDIPRIREEMQVSAETLTPLNTFHRLVLPENKLRWVHNTSNVERLENGDVVWHGFVLDITERKQIEAALAESETKFRSLVEGITDIIFVLEIDGTLIYVSPQFERIFGFNSVDWIGKKPFDMVHPDDRAKLQISIMNLYNKSRTQVQQEFRHICQDGSYLWVMVSALPIFDADGNVIKTQGIIRDISDRKTAELALQASKRRYASLAAAAPVAIYRFDAQANCTYVNETWGEMTGYPLESALGDGWINAIHPEDRPFYREMVADMRANPLATHQTTFTGEGRILQPDGKVVWIYARRVQELDNAGNLIGYVGTLTDITDLKETELALQDAQAQFQRITENVPGMIYRYIYHPDGSGNLVYISSQVENIYEIELDTTLENTMAQIWGRTHPDDVNQMLTMLEEVTKTTKNLNIESRLILPRKGLRWVKDNCYVTHLDNGDVVLDGMVIDITDRKQLELDLEQEISRRTTIFNTSSDGIHILDKQGNLIEANTTFSQMIGYTSEEVKHLHVSDWDAKLSFEELQEIFRTIDWDNSEILRIETLHRRKDGIIFPVDISACTMAWRGQYSLVCIARDISAQKQAEAQLQHTNEQLIRATRLKDEFLANMSHELRTPLNSILGMSELLQEGVFGATNAKQLKALNTIQKSGLHLLELINEILDLAKIESGKMELEYSVVEVPYLCKSSFAFIQQQALRKHIQLHLILPAALPSIRVDERRLRQVLINLLSNAVKFTPEKGQITLEVVPLPSNETSDQGYLNFSVKDTGIGITPENQKKLFQPFVQIDSALNRQYDGTGLGLALVKRIMELHGGQVSVTSEIGIGSCFSIELPYCSSESNVSISESALASKSSIPEMEQPNTKTFILLAEDNEANISTFSSYLEAKGYRVQVAKDGQATINLAQAEPPDIILMDIQMPRIDGLTAIKHIRQLPTLSQIPIIALTAFAMEGDQERCLAAGANMYLSKPVKLKNLALSIQKLTK